MGSDSKSKALNTVAKTLVFHASGTLFFTKLFTLLLYPVATSDWKFLDDSVPSSALDAPLRFAMRVANLDLMKLTEALIPAQMSSPEPSGDIEGIFRKRFSIEFAKLIPYAANRKEVQRPFFLMYPPSHEAERDLFRKFLEFNGPKIYTTAQQDSWDRFQKENETGVVLVCKSSAALRSADACFRRSTVATLHAYTK